MRQMIGYRDISRVVTERRSYSFNDGGSAVQREGGVDDVRRQQPMAAFFKSFRKGFMVCRGLDVNLSGKVAKKTTLTRKSGRHAHNVFLP